MMYSYKGFRIGGAAVVKKNGFPFLPDASLKVWNHSPTGFEWGYEGSGPAQLALAILLDHCDEGTAIELHQKFKRAVIAGLDRTEWEMDSKFIRAWLLQTAKDANGPPPLG